jgi:hypothetical protein
MVRSLAVIALSSSAIKLSFNVDADAAASTNSPIAVAMLTSPPGLRLLLILAAMVDRNCCMVIASGDLENFGLVIFPLHCGVGPTADLRTPS